jgi:KDO2-lipid IV(A) lauroyltransferase
MNTPDQTGKHRSGNRAEAQSVFRSLQQTYPVRLLIRGFLSATKHLPVWLLRAVGRIMVAVFILCNADNFRAVQRNLLKIKPGLPPRTYAYLAYGVFRDYSSYLIDLFHLSHEPGRIDGYAFTITGMENLERALSSGRGVILLASHLGNWELGSLKLTLKDKKIHVVFSPDSSSLLESQRSFLRHADGVQEVPLRYGGFSSLKLLRVLQDGGVVALQGDRLTFDRGIPVTFFGHEALFPKGPVKLALVTDSIVLPVFIPITGYKSYEIIVEAPLYMETGEGVTDELKTNLQKIITILEKYISRYPTQWFTFMPFWEDDKKELTCK